MIVKNCLNCGSTFNAERARNKYCGKDCQHRASRTGKGYVQTRAGTEHRVTMEMHLGRKLLRTEHVHHQSEGKRDNSLENLEILTIQEHTSLHRSKHPKVKPCENCGATFEPDHRCRGRQKTCSKVCRYALTAKSRQSRHS